MAVGTQHAVSDAATCGGTRWVERLVAPVLRRCAALMPQLSAYTIVSVLALAVDLLVFTLLARGGARAAAAGAVGYAAGMLFHYLLSSRFVFDTSRSGKSEQRRLVEFILSGLVGLGLTWAVITVGTDMLHMPAAVSKGVAVAASFLVVFLLRRGVVFVAARRASMVGR